MMQRLDLLQITTGNKLNVVSILRGSLILRFSRVYSRPQEFVYILYDLIYLIGS